MGRNRGDGLNHQQERFSSIYAATGDAQYSASVARYAKPSAAASRELQKPHVQAEIARIQTQRLFAEALPAAVGCLIEIITSPKAPAGARVQAAKVVMDRTLGTDGAGQAKEPHEMTAEELAKAIDELERMASARAKPIEPEPDVFG
jgi:phage terminase small subunit